MDNNNNDKKQSWRFLFLLVLTAMATEGRPQRPRGVDKEQQQLLPWHVVLIEATTANTAPHPTNAVQVPKGRVTRVQCTANIMFIKVSLKLPILSIIVV